MVHRDLQMVNSKQASSYLDLIDFNHGYYLCELVREYVLVVCVCVCVFDKKKTWTKKWNGKFWYDGLYGATLMGQFGDIQFPILEYFPFY